MSTDILESGRNQMDLFYAYKLAKPCSVGAQRALKVRGTFVHRGPKRSGDSDIRADKGLCNGTDGFSSFYTIYFSGEEKVRFGSRGKL